MKYLIIIVVAVAVLGAGGWYVLNRVKAASAANNAPAQTDTITRRTIEKVVSANGKVASNRDVDIKCQASGTIKELPYKDVSVEVKPGEMLCQLDPVDMKRLEDTAKAVVDADNSRISEAMINRDIATKSLETTRQHAQSSLTSAQASLTSARAQADDAHAKAKRTKLLFETKPTALASKEELDTADAAAAQADASVENANSALANANTAIAELDQDKLQIDAREQQITQMKSALAQDQSRYDTSKQNVSYCTVSAPDADNLSDPPRWFIRSLLTNIAPGYIVQSGTSGFSAGTTIMTLSDLSHVYVLASVDEADIGLISDPARGGIRQKVRVTADAFPGRDYVFEGEVVRVATAGVNVSNVVTFEVKIEITSANRTLLRPEMTTTCNIVCPSREDVLAIPAGDFSRNSGAGGGRGPATTPAAAPATAADASTSPPLVADQDTTAPATVPAPATTSAPATRRGGGRGAGRGTGGASRSPASSLGAPQPGIASVQTAPGATETRNVVVGLLGNDPDDPGAGDLYEVISGLNEGDLVVRQTGQDSRFRNNGPNQLMRGLGGGGRGR